jgi:hypothetical protein
MKILFNKLYNIINIYFNKNIYLINYSFLNLYIYLYKIYILKINYNYTFYKKKNLIFLIHFL